MDSSRPITAPAPEPTWSAAEQELLVIWWAAGLKVPEMARRLKKPIVFIKVKTEALPARNPQMQRTRESGRNGNLASHPMDDWSPWEDLIVARLREEGCTFLEIGEALGRTERSCGRRYSQLKYSKKLVPRERRCANDACKKPLSRWNVASECFACQEARAERKV